MSIKSEHMLILLVKRYSLKHNNRLLLQEEKGYLIILPKHKKIFTQISKPR